MERKFRHGSLFSGIGGFDLAAEWMGWQNVFHSEINPFCRKILKHHFPNSIGYEDIKTTDFRGHKGAIDILSGGFPCQPFSVAGKRLGTEDERHLWPQMLRAIREIRPPWIVAENVRGLISWSGGLVFETVCAELETEGYEVLPFLIPAAGVDAPHRRERIWIIAYAKCNDDLREKSAGNGKKKTMEGSEREKNSSTGQSGRADKNDPSGIEPEKCTFAESEKPGSGRAILEMETGDGAQRKSEKCGQEDTESWYIGNKRATINALFGSSQDYWAKANGYGKENCGWETEGSEYGYLPDYWKSFPTQSPLCSGNDGLPSELVDITFPKWRNESIKGLGNAIVPEVAYEIFKAIQTYSTLYSRK